MSYLEDILAAKIRANPNIPQPVKQLKPIPGRKFAFDFAWPEYKLLVEVNGGTYAAYSGRKQGHSTGIGQYRDYVKLNLACIHGWSVMVFDSRMVTGDMAVDLLAQFFKRRQDAEREANI